MADTFSQEKRSEIMSRIRSKNSLAEKIVFAYLRKQKVYFQRHYAKAAGKPDIALPRKKKAVFIDGDFWHGRDYERVLGVTKKEYWIWKIAYNMERDKINNQKLLDEGWAILRIWESDIKRKRTQQVYLENIKKFLLT